MKKSKGFTLIELLAVIVIVGILITLVSIGVTKYVKTSKEKVKVQAAEEIIEIAKAYMTTNNVYLVSTNTLVKEGYLESNFTDPNTGKENQDNGNIFVITCTDDNCTKDTNVSADGFSTNKFYLSLNSTLNSALDAHPFDNSTSEIFSFNKEKLEVEIDDNLYTKNTIGERIQKLYKVNENKGVLVMSLAENEKEKLIELGFENVNNNYYLYYEGETLKSDTIANGNKDNMNYLLAKYILEVIKKNNKNNEIMTPSDSNMKSLGQINVINNDSDITNNVKDFNNVYVFYYTDGEGKNYYSTSLYWSLSIYN